MHPGGYTVGTMNIVPIPRQPLSLQSRLSWLIVASLAVVLALLGVLSARHTLKEVDELSDGRLAQVARALQRLDADGSLATLRVEGGDAMAGIAYRITDARRRMVAGAADAPQVRPTARPHGRLGLARERDVAWRTFVLPRAGGGMIVTAERRDARDALVRSLWFDHGVPAVVALVLAAVGVARATRHELRPLRELAASVAEPPHDGRGGPDELAPVLSALGEQVARLNDALERERAFSASVAHALREPLAVTQQHLEQALASGDAAVAERAVASVRACVGSLARRTEHLLVLARVEAGVATAPAEPVALAELGMEVLETLAPQMERTVTLGVARLDDGAVVAGHRTALLIMLRALLERAVDAVRPEGDVDLSVYASQGMAAVRVVMVARGSQPRPVVDGLDMAIVQRVAQLHGGSVHVESRAGGATQEAVVRLRARPSSGGGP